MVKLRGRYRIKGSVCDRVLFPGCGRGSRKLVITPEGQTMVEPGLLRLTRTVIWSLLPSMVVWDAWRLPNNLPLTSGIRLSEYTIMYPLCESELRTKKNFQKVILTVEHNKAHLHFTHNHQLWVQQDWATYSSQMKRDLLFLEVMVVLLYGGLYVNSADV